MTRFSPPAGQWQAGAMRPAAAPQRGASLIMVMMILVVVSILGISAVQVSMMSERGARNDRDGQVSWQAAEAALVDAEYDIRQLPSKSALSRSEIFGTNDIGAAGSANAGQTVVNPVNLANFSADCSGTGDLVGLCLLPTDPATKPAWLRYLTLDAKTVGYGDKTGRLFPNAVDNNQTGVLSAKKPRYLVEAIRDNGQPCRDASVVCEKYVFRVTAIGYGPQERTQSVVQMIFRN